MSCTVVQDDAVIAPASAVAVSRVKPLRIMVSLPFVRFWGPDSAPVCLRQVSDAQWRTSTHGEVTHPAVSRPVPLTRLAIPRSVEHLRDGFVVGDAADRFGDQGGEGDGADFLGLGDGVGGLDGVGDDQLFQLGLVDGGSGAV